MTVQWHPGEWSLRVDIVGLRLEPERLSGLGKSACHWKNPGWESDGTNSQCQVEGWTQTERLERSKKDQTEGETGMVCGKPVRQEGRTG